MIKIQDYPPKRSGRYKEFRSTENRCTHIGVNKDLNKCRQFKLDGEVYNRNSGETRCDYLLLNDEKKTSYYIELKGSDVNKAIDQIEKTIPEIAPSLLGYKVFRRIVYYTGCHDVNSSKVRLWKKKHNGAAVISNRQYEENI